MVAKEDYSDDFCLKSLAPGQGEYFFIPDILITQQQYGPVNLLVWHNKKYKEALYLLTNLDFPAEISRYYKKRFMIRDLLFRPKDKGISVAQKQAQ
jgi:hypothetical protein